LADHPPKPRLSLSVGIVGHRPNRLLEAGRAKVVSDVTQALATVATATTEALKRYGTEFDNQPAELTLLSGLAEGADRMAATAALEIRYSLAAVLPYFAEEYEHDFVGPDSIVDFRRLVAAAQRVLILDGKRHASQLAYEAVGLTILGNCDLLLAVWDGGPSAGRGGTTDLIERAARDGIPIILVDAKGETGTKLIWSGLSPHPTAIAELAHLPSADAGSSLATVVDALVRPPADEAEARKLSRFLAERWKAWNWRIEVPLMLAAIGLRRLRGTDLRPTPPAVIAQEFSDDLHTPVAGDGTKANDPALLRFAQAYGWVDVLAIRFAQLFRGAYVSSFVLSAVAVLIITPTLNGVHILGWSIVLLALLEAALSAVVLVNTLAGRRFGWHQRWRDARDIAERLRAAVPLRLVSLGTTRLRETRSWTAWYARALSRSVGLTSGTLDAAGLAGIRTRLIALVEAQRHYHAANSAHMDRVARRLNTLSLMMFLLSAAASAANVAVALTGFVLPTLLASTLVYAMAVLPVLGSALLGIRLIGDFEARAMRSARTRSELVGHGAALGADPADLAVLRARASAIADTMIDDVVDWRLMSETKQIE
jgi:hypothetical protein